MCSAPTPKVKQAVTPPPTVAPQPMALASDAAPMNLGQLRVGSKSNLKLQAASSPGTGLSIPS